MLSGSRGLSARAWLAVCVVAGVAAGACTVSESAPTIDVAPSDASATEARDGASLADATVNLDAPLDSGLDGSSSLDAAEVSDAARTVIGPDGGVLLGPDGVSAVVPMGALAADTSFRVEGIDAPGADGGVERIYRFLPPTLFARPVTVRLPLAAGSTSGELYWSRVGGLGGYDPMGAVSGGAHVTATVVHFGAGYSGALGPTRTVVGSNVRAHLASTFETFGPRQMGAIPLTVLVAEDGGTRSIAGQGYVDGTFRVADVPRGPYLLRWGAADHYFRDGESAIDLGTAVDGRPAVSLSAPATGTTTVTFNVTNLEPWTAGSSLDMFSTQAGLAARGVESEPLAKNVPQADAGATALVNLTVPLRERDGAPARRVEGTKGDRLHLFQLSSRSSSTGVAALVLTREFDAPAFDATFGSDSPLAGAFTALPLSNSLDLTVKMSEFWAQPAEYGGAAETGVVLLSVRAQPFTLRHGFPESAPRLVQMRLLSAPVGTDVTTGLVPYGLPLVGTWAPFVDLAMRATRDYALPGNAPVSHVFNAFSEQAALAPTAVMTLAPSVSPPRAVRVNGSPLTLPATAVGTTPLFEWDPPRVGAAAGYRAYLFRLTSASSTTSLAYVATLDTSEPRFRIPAGLLLAGSTYFIELRARHRPSVSLARSPERDEMPAAEATMVTEPFSP
ncbi:MAG: hypothetical protein IPG50_17150 [Myxococcales bacterium]|nr:hypothetical protein [Myxococcales bacterium]